MMVLVDTPIWSLALRRRPKSLSLEQQALTQELADLIREGRAQLLGPIRQELLSGIRDDAQFRRLQQHLIACDDVHLSPGEYEQAARASNHCRSRGVAGRGRPAVVSAPCPPRTASICRAIRLAP